LCYLYFFNVFTSKRRENITSQLRILLDDTKDAYTEHSFM
jgi:hypothetical protein